MIESKGIYLNFTLSIIKHLKNKHMNTIFSIEIKKARKNPPFEKEIYYVYIDGMAYGCYNTLKEAQNNMFLFIESLNNLKQI